MAKSHLNKRYGTCDLPGPWLNEDENGKDNKWRGGEQKRGAFKGKLQWGSWFYYDQW